MKKQNSDAINEHSARAKANDLSISTKHCIEICNYLRYKNTAFAKNVLEEVVALRKPIPFKRFKSDMGHKPGMAAGRFPQKAANEILRLVKAVETNAQFKGLNTANLKITKILANRASIPMTGGRRSTATKRTHVEIEVMEIKEKKRKKEEKIVKAEAKPETKEVVEEKKTAPTKEEAPVEKEAPQEPVKEEKSEEIIHRSKASGTPKAKPFSESAEKSAPKGEQSK
ncbi:50S ribosomal protein L22 [Candidatus Woesearchaeota archaeon]|nr:50S ribosomal protein L22 [Candidatus Woesearchaeota archaeon]